MWLNVCTDQTCFWALIFTPGPMVEAVTQERMYWPFAAAGFVHSWLLCLVIGAALIIGTLFVLRGRQSKTAA